MNTDLDALRELLAKATPTPWQAKDPYLWDEIVGDIDGPDDGQYHYTEVAQAFGRADAALIVEAVNALPGLLADYAALQARIAELETEAEERENELSEARETCAAEYERDAARALRSVMALIPKDDSDEPMTAHQQFDAIAERIAELEARNAASQRDDEWDAGYQCAAREYEADAKRWAFYVYAMTAKCGIARNAIQRQAFPAHTKTAWDACIDKAMAEVVLPEAANVVSIDAHAQGQAGEEKDG